VSARILETPDAYSYMKLEGHCKALPEYLVLTRSLAWRARWWQECTSGRKKICSRGFDENCH
jgi:hypothetical protein